MMLDIMTLMNKGLTIINGSAIMNQDIQRSTLCPTLKPAIAVKKQKRLKTSVYAIKRKMEDLPNAKIVKLSERDIKELLTLQKRDIRMHALNAKKYNIVEMHDIGSSVLKIRENALNVPETEDGAKIEPLGLLKLNQKNGQKQLEKNIVILVRSAVQKMVLWTHTISKTKENIQNWQRRLIMVLASVMYVTQPVIETACYNQRGTQ